MIRNFAHWSAKPALGHALERTHPLAQNRFAGLFCEAGGTRVIDLTGSGNTGTISGSPIPTYQIDNAIPSFGDRPKGIVLNSNIVSTSNSSAVAFSGIKVGGTFTFAARVAITAALISHAPILMDSAGNNGFRLNSPGSGRQIAWNQAGTVFTSAGNNFTVGPWYHVAVTYDGATLTFYSNGLACGTAALASGGNVTLTTMFSDNLGSFAGLIDYLYVYDGIVLSAGDVQWLAIEPYTMFMRDRTRSWLAIAGAAAVPYFIGSEESFLSNYLEA